MGKYEPGDEQEPSTNPAVYRMLPQVDSVYVIGDVHGCKPQLVKLLHLILQDQTGPVQIHRDPHIVFVGDLIDRGPDSLGVVELVEEMIESDLATCIRGNHEDMLIRGLLGGNPNNPGDHNELDMWLYNGGAQVVEEFKFSSVDQDVYGPLRVFARRLNDMTIPAAIMGNLLFVHAGVDPDYPADQQTLKAVAWIRNHFLHHPDKFLDGQGNEMFVVHGHTPVSQFYQHTNRINVDTGAVFGGQLTAVRFDKKPDGRYEYAKLIQVDGWHKHVEVTDNMSLA